MVTGDINYIKTLLTRRPGICLYIKRQEINIHWKMISNECPIRKCHDRTSAESSRGFFEMRSVPVKENPFDVKIYYVPPATFHSPVETGLIK